ncbi:MAG: metallo-mystery pair system four-Cys motif protein [Deltaproteobacteria bacterium]|nr:MAG: metallo-mystery pair system four-Cys motif protein [Deltaproteobacteria bacterium]
MGTTNSTITTNDFRFYVHDVRLVDATGTEVPVTIETDGMWALDGTVLLDFEDGSSTCTGGNPQLNSTIVGTVPVGTYTGVRFTMGVPFGQNHNIDVATAPAPLNVTSMFWNWQGGYKFLRIDGVSAGISEGWRQHLGSTGCDGDPTGGVTACTNTNSVAVAFDGFDATANTIVADLALLLQDTDIDTNTADTPPGCMATITDPDCAGVFANLGLDHLGVAGGTQAFFRME